jgi:F-type H+-transporting ATPase subunit a
MGPVIVFASGIGAIAIFFLEVFVATLQAFVFMFLTTVFISQLAHHDDHEHGEAHGHEHAHA